MMIETKMNIDLAVKHLTWRLQQPKIIPNEKDKEAFNCILSTLNQNYDTVIMEDILLAKLVAERLLFLTVSGERTMKSAIEVIKEILSTSLFGWGKLYQEQVPMIKLTKALEEALTGIYKPMPVQGSEYDALPTGHIYIGVNLKTIPKIKPFSTVMLRGSVDRSFVLFKPTQEAIEALPMISF